MGYLTWQNEQLLQRLDYQTQTQQQTTEQQTQQRAAEAFWNDYNAGINEYAGKTPDYQQAADFLVDSRRKRVGGSGSPTQPNRTRCCGRSPFRLRLIAKERGQNHAEIFYNLARQRGYRSGDAIGITPGKDKINVPPGIAAKQNLDNVKRGSQAATSLSNMGGGEEDAELSAEALISMTDEEFQVATSGKKWNRLHGR